MSQLDKLYIAATGMITPVGINSEMTAASIKAGVNVYQASSFMNRHQYPMKLAKVPDDALCELNEKLLSLRMSGQEKRMLAMASNVVEQIFEMFTPSRPIPIFIAATESIPEKESPINKDFIDKLIIQTEIQFDKLNSCVSTQGRAAGIQLLDNIFQCLENEENNYALLLGVDSYIDADLLSVLDEDERVLTEVSSDGFAPGEAATAVLLVSERAIHKVPNVMASLMRPGIAEEPGHRFSNDPMLGSGLSTAISIAIDNNESSPINRIYSSFNGESFHNKEFGVATIRNSRSISSEFLHEHPADCFGDIGAAFAPTLIALSSLHIFEEPSTVSSLVYCSSEQALRAAVCINKVNQVI